ncbi:MAG: chemotaxis protein CheW [Candidatus Competibacteraceae bacterium]
MAKSTAWLLHLKDAWRTAVGERELVHLIEEPTLLDIPVTPFYCRQVLIWENQILPVLDLAAWLAGQPLSRAHKLVGVFAYQEHLDAVLSYGAVPLESVPTRRVVDDQDACELPTEPIGWRQVTISCFSDGGHAVPILDLPYIFSGALLSDVMQ